MKPKYTLLLMVFLLLLGFASVLFIKSEKNILDKQLVREDKDLKYSKAELAWLWADYEFEKTRDPKTNALPYNIRQRELAFVSSIPSRDDYNTRQFYRGILPEVQVSKWNSRGPVNVGGRMKVIAFDSGNENIVLAGSASGGVWRSTDKGQTWVRTSTPEQMQRVSSLAQDTRPGKRNIWYYGTGELLSTTDRKISLVPRTIGLGDGIYKSTDGGLSWSALPKTTGNPKDKLSGIFQGVWEIVVDPVNTSQDVIYAACYGAIMRSTDGGANWSVTLGDTAHKSFCTDVAITSQGVVYAALSDYTVDASHPQKAGIWRSEDGVNWINITPSGFPDASNQNNYRVMRLALAPSNEKVMYVLTETPPGYIDQWSWSVSSHYLWRYNESATDKWENRSANLPPKGIPTKAGNLFPLQQQLQSLGGYALNIKVKPDDENAVVIGGTTLFRSSSGFADTLHSAWMGGYPFDMAMTLLHPDMHNMAFLPSNTNVLYVANDGGLQKTDNFTATVPAWTSLNNALVASQFYSAVVDHSAAGDPFIVGGLQDNFTQYTTSEDFSSPWRPVIGGDGLNCAVPNGKPFVIGSYYNGAVETFLLDKNLNSYLELYQTPDILKSNQFAFFTVFALDSNNKTFYLPALNNLWRKDDMLAASKNESLRNAGWSRMTNATAPADCYISTITAAAQPSDRIYYGTNTGRVFRVDNPSQGDPQKIEITGQDFPANAFVVCIEPDPKNADRLFAVFSNYNVQSIFFSSDGGASWTAEGGNLEENPDGAGAGPSVRWVKMLHVGDRTIYFAGTSAGLYSTTELSGTQTQWLKEGASTIGNAIIDMVDSREADGLVVVATQGSGVFSTYVKELSADTNKETDNFKLGQNYPNPADMGTTVDFTVPMSTLVNLRITDNTGRQRLLVTKVAYLGQNSIFINTGALASGAYFYTLESPFGKLHRKMIVAR